MKTENTTMLYRDPVAMCPMLPETHLAVLEALSADVIANSGKLSQRLHPLTSLSIANLVEPMNSYYSNLIEGRPTHPLDIERVLRKELDKTDKNFDVKLEAVAHVEVNKWMKTRVHENTSEVFSTEFVCWLHKVFYNYLPEEYRVITLKNGNRLTIAPGVIRNIEVEVGNHIAPAHDKVNDFLNYMWNSYSEKQLASPLLRLIAIGAAHHRLAWVHPFADGNGRVARLFSEALFIKEGCAANGLWSISRGLARNKATYYDLLSNADQKRWNDYDGHGNLSDKALFEFCKFFLEVSKDQIAFMNSLMDLDGVVERIDRFVDLMVVRRRLERESKYILREVFAFGSVRKGDLMRITGKSDPIARRIANTLIKEGLLEEGEGFRSALRVKIPLHFAGHYFPGLYPAEIEATLDR